MSGPRRLSVAGVTLAVTLASVRAAADEPARDGAYVSLAVGYGYTGYLAHTLYNQLQTGSTEIVALAAGGAIAPDLLLYGTVEFDSLHTFTSATSSTALFSLGAGVAYLVGPSGLVFSTSLRAVELNWFATDAGFSGTGLGLDAAVGKDLRIARRWSLGVAGRLSVATVGLQAERITPFGLALLVSLARR